MSQPFLKPTTQKLDQTEWESHKNRIVDLWLHNDLTVVMQTMADEVGFIATKSQYTKQLNEKWKVKKYFTDQELDHIEDRIKERELEGKVTRVKRYGQKISKENLKRRKARRFVKTIDKFQKIAPKPVQLEQIDLNIDIGTPTTLASIMTPKSIYAGLRSPGSEHDEILEDMAMAIDHPISNSIRDVPEHTLNWQPWRSRGANEVSVTKEITWETHVRHILDQNKKHIKLYSRNITHFYWLERDKVLQLLKKLEWICPLAEWPLFTRYIALHDWVKFELYVVTNSIQSQGSPSYEVIAVEVLAFRESLTARIDDPDFGYRHRMRFTEGIHRISSPPGENSLEEGRLFIPLRLNEIQFEEFLFSWYPPSRVVTLDGARVSVPLVAPHWLG